METKRSVKQFDLGHIRIDENLQGVKLASFSRRFIAYALDWIIISVCTQFVLLIIPLFLLLLLLQKKFQYTIKKSRRVIKKSVLNMGRKLEENTTIAPTLKRRFNKSMVIYINILLYLPIIASVLYLISIGFEYFSPTQYAEVAENTGSFLHFLTRPVFDLTDSFGLLIKFFGAFLYFSVFTWKWQGQTPGKRLLKISIVKLDGSKISFWNSFERVSGYTASASIVFLGFIQYYWDKNAQTTHDKIAETIVIEVEKSIDQVSGSENAPVSENTIVAAE